MISEEEKYRLACEYLNAEDRGDTETAEKIMQQIPIGYKSAMAAKEVWGAEFLKRLHRDLSEAEEVYGKDWLDK